MRVVVTGGAGFIGRAVVRRLADRGDTVVALVRDPARARHLERERVELVANDMSDVASLVAAVRGADAIVHAAGSYRVGITPSERPAMWDANVGTTERVIDAALAAGVPRVVYVSTVNVFGNTHGQLVDESYRRDLRGGFVSWYDQTKYRAHAAVENRMANGAPIVIVMPSQVYGPGDHSAVGDQLQGTFDGRLAYRALDEVGLCLVHVDDLAAGIVAALGAARVGESYVLSGPNARLRDALAIAARLGGRKLPPRVPTTALRALAPIGSLAGQPNLAELIDAAAGVTYWASHEKATRELGFEPRSLEQGIADTFRRA